MEKKVDPKYTISERLYEGHKRRKEEHKRKIKFKILNDNREVELACYYAKRNKEEMRDLHIG